MWRTSGTCAGRVIRLSSSRLPSRVGSFGGSRFCEIQSRFLEMHHPPLVDVPIRAQGNEAANWQSDLSTKHGETPYKILKRSTSALLATPKLSWGPLEWRDSEKILHGWSFEVKPTEEAIRRAFEVFDRMVIESESQDSTLGPLTLKHVDMLLDRWRIGTRNRLLTKKREFAAQNVLRRLDDYTGRIAGLQLGTKSYSMLMAGHIKQSPHDATAFCSEIIQRMKATSSEVAAPNSTTLNYLIDAHVKSSQSSAHISTQAIFDFMVEQAKENEQTALAPNEKTLTRVLQAWIACSEASWDEAASHVRRSLGHMLESSRKNTDVLPNSLFLTLVLDHCKERGNTSWAIRLFDKLLGEVIHSVVEFPHLLPESRVFGRMVHLWSKSGLPEAPERAEYWLDTYYALSQVSPDLEPPRATLYHAAIFAWEKSGDEEAPIRCSELWRRLIRRTDGATAKGYVRLLLTWYSSQLEEASSKVEEVLSEMCQASLHRPELLPSAQVFTETTMHLAKERGHLVLLKLWVKTVKVAAESRVPGSLAFVTDLAKEISRRRIYLDTQSYREMVLALAMIGDPRGLEEWLDHMNQDHLDCGPDLLLDILKSVQTLGGNKDLNQVRGLVENLLDRTWSTEARTTVSYEESEEEEEDAGNGPDLGQMLLKQLQAGECSFIQINAFHEAMDYIALSEHPSAGRRAEVLLLHMQEMHETGRLAGQPTFETFRKVMECWLTTDNEVATERATEVLFLAEKLTRDGDKSMQPDRPGYTLAIDAWSKTQRPDAPEKIQELMRAMKRRYDDGEGEFEPKCEEYRALIEAYAHSGHPDSFSMATTVFERTPKRFRNTTLYNAWIGTLGGDANGAEAILREMHLGYLEGNQMVKPNTETFNQVLRAWSKSGSTMAAWRADGIFQRMDELSKTGELDVRPNVKTFDLVISTLANEYGGDGALKVDRYLELLKEYYRSGAPDCSPSVTSYTEAIRAWGSNIEDPRAVLRAKALLDEMHELASEIETVQPDYNTYLVYLEALQKSSADSKAQLAIAVASTMRRRGMSLGDAFLWNIQRCCIPNDAIRSSWTIELSDELNENDDFYKANTADFIA